MTRRNILRLIKATIWRWATGAADAAPIRSAYDRDAEMRACVHRHGGMKIVRWILGRWVAEYAPWALVEHAEFSPAH